ncbi:MAG: helix-turn-helix domain-containing protein [Solobacterium sp.]|jgi:transcriptional regulator with XRE-family HTH domain|nr:helix-turn-helix domain-containing protein [Solobacterium sp.]MCH4050321.1 helix-turn-helix domain-containing protein [Solobacterium sp.]MCH4075722.1 helix-turn-helix domain-containing protein [Solobacterium sp.]MCI1312895.1 helix-turn-helix domain-containing protein [Solobacterium sp.]MCI1345426.1 helix-turn-helix domain-containing protein [Solobacterium sp.]
MEFGEQIRQIRQKEQLTQAQLAEKLHVTRQAVSNWENNKNLPDLEMIILIAQTFHVTLDWLILGGENMNQMTEKLIEDGRETNQAKFRYKTALIGLILAVLGVVMIVIEGSTSYVAENGMLMEHFWMIPIGLLLILSGVITILVSGIHYLGKSRKAK